MRSSNEEGGGVPGVTQPNLLSVQSHVFYLGNCLTSCWTGVHVLQCQLLYRGNILIMNNGRTVSSHGLLLDDTDELKCAAEGSVGIGPLGALEMSHLQNVVILPRTGHERHGTQRLGDEHVRQQSRLQTEPELHVPVWLLGWSHGWWSAPRWTDTVGPYWWGWQWRICSSWPLLGWASKQIHPQPVEVQQKVHSHGGERSVPQMFTLRGLRPLCFNHIIEELTQIKTPRTNWPQTHRRSYFSSTCHGQTLFVQDWMFEFRFVKMWKQPFTQVNEMFWCLKLIYLRLSLSEVVKSMNEIRETCRKQVWKEFILGSMDVWQSLFFLHVVSRMNDMKVLVNWVFVWEGGFSAVSFPCALSDPPQGEPVCCDTTHQPLVVRQHDDNLSVMVPDHPPEVSGGVRQRMLGDDELITPVVALRWGRSDVIV